MSLIYLPFQNYFSRASSHLLPDYYSSFQTDLPTSNPTLNQYILYSNIITYQKCYPDHNLVLWWTQNNFPSQRFFSYKWQTLTRVSLKSSKKDFWRILTFIEIKEKPTGVLVSNSWVVWGVSVSEWLRSIWSIYQALRSRFTFLRESNWLRWSHRRPLGGGEGEDLWLMFSPGLHAGKSRSPKESSCCYLKNY